jgi:hypothetical protein
MLASVAALAWLPVAALTGKVVDAEGNPVPNANACLIVDGVPGFCTTTDENGNFDLLDTDVSRMRISAPDYLPKYLPAMTQEEPIVLRRAARILVRLVDASTGEGIPKGKVTLTYPSGLQKGPFPSNRAGVRVRQLLAAEVLVRAEADGYRTEAGQSARLVAGEQTDVTVQLEPLREDPPAPRGDS